MLACVTAAGGQWDCRLSAADDYFDAILALDMRTGAIKWVTEAIPFDAWTVACIPSVRARQLPGAGGPD